MMLGLESPQRPPQVRASDSIDFTGRKPLAIKQDLKVEDIAAWQSRRPIRRPGMAPLSFTAGPVLSS
jgi:hypothetical protein